MAELTQTQLSFEEKLPVLFRLLAPVGPGFSDVCTRPGARILASVDARLPPFRRLAVVGAGGLSMLSATSAQAAEELDICSCSCGRVWFPALPKAVAGGGENDIANGGGVEPMLGLSS